MTTDPDPGNAGAGSDSGVIKKTVVGVAGGVVTAAGIVMLVTPGPGVIVTLAGLGILAREFPSVRSQIERFRPGNARRDDAGGTPPDDGATSGRVTDQ